MASWTCLMLFAPLSSVIWKFFVRCRHIFLQPWVSSGWLYELLPTIALHHNFIAASIFNVLRFDLKPWSFQRYFSFRQLFPHQLNYTLNFFHFHISCLYKPLWLYYSDHGWSSDYIVLLILIFFVMSLYEVT